MILIMGGAGYIGSHTLRHLLDCGYDARLPTIWFTDTGKRLIRELLLKRPICSTKIP